MKRMILSVLALCTCTLLTACLAAKQGGAAASGSGAQAEIKTDGVTDTEESAKLPVEEAKYHKITPDEAKNRMESGDSIVVVDVRTQEEYQAGHIENAILIPNEGIRHTKPEHLPDLSAEILVYCRSGVRSEQAVNKLVSMGYTNVYDFGGILSWTYETVAD